eukprot:EG_transcript_315
MPTTVFGVATPHDGSLAVSQDAGKLFRAENEQRVPITCLCFDDQGNLFTVDASGWVYAFYLQAKRFARLRQLAGAGLCCGFNPLRPTELVVALVNHHVVVLDVDQRTEVTALRHQHELPVEWLAFAPGTRGLMCTGSPDLVLVWDVSTNPRAAPNYVVRHVMRRGTATQTVHQMVLTDDFVIARRRRALDIYRIADMSFMRKLCVPKAMADKAAGLQALATSPRQDLLAVALTTGDASTSPSSERISRRTAFHLLLLRLPGFKLHTTVDLPADTGGVRLLRCVEAGAGCPVVVLHTVCGALLVLDLQHFRILHSLAPAQPLSAWGALGGDRCTVAAACLDGSITVHCVPPSPSQASDGLPEGKVDTVWHTRSSSSGSRGRRHSGTTPALGTAGPSRRLARHASPEPLLHSALHDDSDLAPPPAPRRAGRSRSQGAGRQASSLVGLAGGGSRRSSSTDAGRWAMEGPYRDLLAPPHTIAKRDALRLLLQNNGRFPVRHRAELWRALLLLPHNTAAFATLSHKQPHPAAERQLAQFTGKVGRPVLERALSALNWHCENLAAVQPLPEVVQVWLEVFVDPIDVFECSLAYLANWGREYYTHYPNAGAPLTTWLAAMLAESDRELWLHLKQHKCSPKVYIWGLLRNVLGSVFSDEDRRFLLDRVLAEPPRWLFGLVLAYLRLLRSPLMQLRTPLDFQLFFSRHNPVAFQRLFELASEIAASPPLPFDEGYHQFQAIDRDGEYVLLLNFAHRLLEDQVEHWRRIRRAEEDVLRSRQVAIDLHEARCKQEQLEERKLQEIQALCEAEEVMRRTMDAEERQAEEERQRNLRIEQLRRLRHLEAAQQRAEEREARRRQLQTLHAGRLQDEVGRQRLAEAQRHWAALTEDDLLALESQVATAGEEERFMQYVEAHILALRRELRLPQPTWPPPLAGSQGTSDEASRQSPSFTLPVEQPRRLSYSPPSTDDQAPALPRPGVPPNPSGPPASAEETELQTLLATARQLEADVHRQQGHAWALLGETAVATKTTAIRELLTRSMEVEAETSGDTTPPGTSADVDPQLIHTHSPAVDPQPGGFPAEGAVPSGSVADDAGEAEPVAETASGSMTTMESSSASEALSPEQRQYLQRDFQRQQRLYWLAIQQQQQESREGELRYHATVDPPHPLEAAESHPDRPLEDTLPTITSSQPDSQDSPVAPPSQPPTAMSPHDPPEPSALPLPPPSPPEVPVPRPPLLTREVLGRDGIDYLVRLLRPFLALPEGAHRPNLADVQPERCTTAAQTVMEAAVGPEAEAVVPAPNPRGLSPTPTASPSPLPPRRPRLKAHARRSEPAQLSPDVSAVTPSSDTTGGTTAESSTLLSTSTISTCSSALSSVPLATPGALLRASLQPRSYVDLLLADTPSWDSASDSAALSTASTTSKSSTGSSCTDASRRLTDRMATTAPFQGPPPTSAPAPGALPSPLSPADAPPCCEPSALLAAAQLDYDLHRVHLAELKAQYRLLQAQQERLEALSSLRAWPPSQT